MSNKTQLQANNTSLEALITRVNAAKDTAASLPEASGGGGGYQISIGTVLSGGFVLEVSDLPFTPKYVAIFTCDDNNTRRAGLMGSSEIGTFNDVQYSSEAVYHGSTGGTECTVSTSGLEITDNGFVIFPMDSIASAYRYIAIG